MKKALKKLTLLITSFLLGTTLCITTTYAKDFTIKDVPKTDASYEQIQWVLNQNYMGLAAGKFLPNSYVRRNEFAVILSKINGDISALSNPKKPTFLDVNAKDQFYKHIETEKENMTFFKTSKGKMFKPTSYLTREDACMSIVKVLGYDKASDSDVGTDVSLSDVISDSDTISPSMLKYVTLQLQTA